MLRVGLTGGLGPGRSPIQERFGDTVFGADGTLGRPALGRVVFRAPEALADLETLLDFAGPATTSSSRPRDATAARRPLP